MRQNDENKDSRNKTAARRRGKFDALWFFECMDQVNRAMQGTNDLEQVMKDVLDTLLAVFECDRAWLVYPCDPDSPTWQVPMERTRPEYPGVLPIGVELPLDPVGAEVYRILRNANGPVKFGAGEEHPVPKEIASAFKVQSFIAMAFHPKTGKPWSFGLHQCSHARVWSLDEERLFQEIGHRLSDTLSTLLAYRDLQDRESQINQMIETSPVAMLISAGEEERVVTVNDKFVEMFGYNIEDIPDVAHWWHLAYPDQDYRASVKTQWEEKAQKAIQLKGQIEPMEARVKCKDGSIRFIEFQFSSIGMRHLVTFTDLTARKQAEESLRERERHSQSLLRLSRRLEQAQTYSDVLNAAQDEVREIIGYQNLWAFLFTPDKKQATALFAKGPMADKVMSKEGTATISVQGDRMMEEFVETKDILVIEDAQTDERTDKKIAAKMGNRTLVHVPILLFDRLMGSVGTGTFGDEGVRAPTESEREYLVAFASHMAVTFDRIHLSDQRRQAEQALRENEEKFRTLIEQSAEGVILADENGIIVEWNHANERMMGLTREQVLGQPLWDVMVKLINPERATPERREAIKSGILEALKGGTSPLFHAPMEMEFYPPPGREKRFLHQNIFPIRTEKGYRIAALVEDFTEREQAEEALRDSERRLTEAQRIAHVGYWERNFEAGRIILSDEACRIFGLTPQEVPHNLEQWHQHWLNLIHPEDQMLTGQAAANALGDGPPYNVDYRIVRPDGEVRFIHSEANVRRDESGRPRYMLGMMQDITERKRMEEALAEQEREFRTLAEYSPDNIARYDTNCQTVYVNPTLEKTLGRPASEMLGTFPAQAGFIKEGSEYQEKINAVLSTGKEQEMDLVLPDMGTGVRYHNIRFVAERDADGAITGIQAIGRDITERKRHELEQEAILTVSTSLRQASTRAEIISIILDKILELFEADGAVMVLPDLLNGGYIDEMGRGPVGERMVGLNIPHGKGVCDWVIKNKKSYLNNQAQNDPLFYRPDLLGNSNCLATVPLITHEYVIGAIWIARKKEISGSDLRLFNAIADLAANAIHRITLHERTERQLHNLLALHQIDIAITTSFDLDTTLNIILTFVRSELAVDSTSVLLLNTSTNLLEYAAGLGFKTDNIKRSSVEIGDGFSGRAALELCTVSCPDLKLYPGFFSRSLLLAEENFASHFATPLLVQGKLKGVLEVFHRVPYEPNPEWIAYFETLATQAALAIQNYSLLQNLQQSNRDLTHAYDATIEGWSRALDLRDRETEGHTRRVTEMVLELADRLGISSEEKADIKRGALLHDIGKMGVPDSILHKPGPLTDDERTIMRKHPTYAFQMLSPIPYLKYALDIPYCHHEKWDGSGYPRGLKGDEIPLSARMFAVVDVFDALTSDRPYRKAWTHEETRRYIESQAGVHFDSQIVEVFIEIERSKTKY